MNDEAQDALGQIAVAAGRLETVIVSLQQQTQDAQAQMQATREQEEAKFKQAMVALFQAQQQRMESALLPRIAWAWKIIATLAMCFVLLLMGFFLLLNQANDQLHAARARAAAADVRADVQEAARHVEITSCGGRPCIKLDKRTPTWQSQGSEYIAKAANTFWWMPHPITRHDSGRRPTIDRVNDALGKDRAENVRAVHVPFGDKTLFMHAGETGGVTQQPVEQSLMQAKAIKQDQGQTQQRGQGRRWLWAAHDSARR